MAEICRHIAVSHEKPKSPSDAYDNLSFLLSIIKGLFFVIHQTLSGQENEIAEVAGLGTALSEELGRRAQVLLDFAQAVHKKEG